MHPGVLYPPVLAVSGGKEGGGGGGPGGESAKAEQWRRTCGHVHDRWKNKALRSHFEGHQTAWPDQDLSWLAAD
jgi:hypothetical protein